MSGLFDRLQNELDIREKQGGITALDLAELPTPLRKMMRAMLRELQMTRAEIAKVVSELPEDERKEIKDLNSALITLTKQGWLIALGEGDNLTYKVNLQRKRGSQLASSIFNKLEERIDERKQDQSEDSGEKGAG